VKFIRGLWHDRMPMTSARWVEMGVACTVSVVLALFLAVVIAVSLHGWPAHGRDLGKKGVDWDSVNTDPVEREWYKVARFPDGVQLCCGEADAYWADAFDVQGDKYVAIITDDRPDGPRGRVHRPVGTRVVVPNHKIKRDQPNPLGHGVIFLSPSFPVDHPNAVYCYFAPGGV
jgi:hypothetical protein